jgi:hypothetical protein
MEFAFRIDHRQSTLPSGHMMKISGLYRHTIFYFIGHDSNCVGAS